MRVLVGTVAGLLVTLAVSACGSSSSPVQPTAGFSGGDQSGIPSSLQAGARPIGRGPRFQPSLSGSPGGRCSAELGRRDQAHVELFAANRVVLLSIGIGTNRPRSFLDGRLTHADCFGSIVTLDPTGTVYFRPSQNLTLGALFRAWGQPLTSHRIASFTGEVSLYVNGRRRSGSAASLALAPYAEIVLEVGPHVPPHHHFSFPELPSRTLR